MLKSMISEMTLTAMNSIFDFKALIAIHEFSTNLHSQRY